MIFIILFLLLKILFKKVGIDIDKFFVWIVYKIVLINKIIIVLKEFFCLIVIKYFFYFL